MNKDRHIISELNSFFAESNNTKAIQGIMNVMSHITLNHRQMDFVKAANCKFTAKDCLGSERSVVDLSDGRVLEQNDYYAYGERVADSTMQTTSFLHTLMYCHPI